MVVPIPARFNLNIHSFGVQHDNPAPFLSSFFKGLGRFAVAGIDRRDAFSVCR
jgi:hypothetical protein